LELPVFHRPTAQCSYIRDGVVAMHTCMELTINKVEVRVQLWTLRLCG
jgi:hypothetical protein